MKPDLSISKKYNYSDYLTWDEGRWEIINGEVFDMSPAPKTEHQRILRKLALSFGNYLENKDCEMFISPFDVRFEPYMKQVKDDEEDKIYTVVQPDISIFCDDSKIDKKGALGAPDLVIEIVSESSKEIDWGKKLLLYQNNGVREYWIVEPEKKMITVFQMDDSGRYTTLGEYAGNDKTVPALFPDLTIELQSIFK